MTDLLAWLEVAEAGSRELDAAIADLFDPVPDQHDGFPGRWPFVDGSPFSDQTPPVTTCVTAALALASRVLPDANCMGFDSDPRGADAYVSRNEVPREQIWLVEARAKTPALALCAAILRAKGAEQ